MHFVLSLMVGPTFGHHLHELHSFPHHWHNSLVLLTRIFMSIHCQNMIFMHFKYN
jgi:hypothetical protein